MQYLRARWYDPNSGRFISKDTYEGSLDNPLSMNLYTYVENNPLIFTDPTGHYVNTGPLLDFKYELGLAIKDVHSKKQIDYRLWKERLLEYFEPVFNDNNNTFNYLFDLATQTSSYKNSKGNSDWARTYLLEAYSAYITPTVYSSFLGNLGMLDPQGGLVKGKNGTSSSKALKGCNCFTAGTKVLTDEGEKNIEDIEVGEKVLSKDENNSDGELAYKEVTYLYRNQRDDIIKLYVGEQVIETTDNHPFWVEGEGWVFADELQVGDKLQKADGSNLTIDKVEFVKLDEPVTVYNFTVADFHTYYVTDIGIWVHNTECSVTVSKSAARTAKKLSPEAKKGYDAAIKGLESGDLRGLNAHPLSGNRKGQWAVDIKGSGGGRGDARIIYTKDSDGNITVVEVITSHKEY